MALIFKILPRFSANTWTLKGSFPSAWCFVLLCFFNLEIRCLGEAGKEENQGFDDSTLVFCAWGTPVLCQISDLVLPGFPLVFVTAVFKL